MNRLPKDLTDEQLAALYEQINEGCPTGLRNRAMIQTMADCGLRIAEVAALRVVDIVRENGRIKALRVEKGKGAKDRTVYCTPEASDKLLRWLDARSALGINGTAPVFCSMKQGIGRPVSTAALRGVVKGLAAKAGLPTWVSPHNLRHTFATRRLRATGNLRIVQEDLGHSQLTTTQIYTHISNAEREQAALSMPPVDKQEPEQIEALTLEQQVAALTAQVEKLVAQQAATGGR